MTAVCVNCAATVELETHDGWPVPDEWIDPDRQDSDNEGAYCPDGQRHEVVTDPVCQSCDDRAMGCSRCTDADGDKR